MRKITFNVTSGDVPEDSEFEIEETVEFDDDITDEEIDSAFNAWIEEKICCFWSED